MPRFSNILVLVYIIFTFFGCDTKIKNSSPNVILIYADDLGRGLLTHEGQKIIKTPHIDKLAESGVRFENVYGGMFCSPARASLLTGYHDLHTDKWDISRAGLYSDITRGKYSREQVESAYNKQATPVPESEVFLAEVFKKSGYVTAQVGKLDWGFATTHKQLKRHGWDYYYGYYDHQRCHGFYPPFLFEDGNMVTIEGNTRADCGKTAEWDKDGGYEDRWNMDGKEVYSQNLFLDKMIQFLRNNRDAPFFLYHPTQLPHGPSSVPEIHPDFVSNKNLTEIEKTYASMVKMLDDHVGVIVEELKTLGLYENTIIVFSSDNGHEIYYPSEGKINKPMINMQTGKKFDNINTKYYSELVGDVFNGNDGMAGMKRDNWEGAVRVPLIYHWPGNIEGGKIIQTKVANYDLISTFADLLNVALPEEKDGLSYLPEILGKEAGKLHKYIVFSSFHGPALVTQEGWKLRHFGPKDTYQLYYLPDDYREESNLSEKHPELLERLKKELIEACSGDIKNGWFSYQSGILELPEIQNKD
ncbi:sulfatase-like hydrolase/transferase [Algibacter mikhailovii]|uniref:Arylsulfatase n=1 Tax=Algibacter mikhailovii TaxID=425498 RepID=A0A918R9P4_9FLAO|nr:sulfatase-like hydrolase/transferase [Algibacter mikhailovii]GGZ87492.1 arylsulfatase [Algibacter mikhailovii]